MKGQRVAHIARVTCFDSEFDVYFITILFSPDVHVVGMIGLPQSIVSLGEAMYQCLLEP